jgi:hypothetical protein
MLKSLERCGITNSLEPTTPVANRTAAQDGVAVQLDRYVPKEYSRKRISYNCNFF